MFGVWDTNMKSNIFNEKNGFKGISKYYIECSCGCEKQLIFTLFQEDNGYWYSDIDLNYSNNGLFNKLKNIWRYLLNKSPLCYGGIIVHEWNIEDLEEIVNKIKELKHEQL